MTSLAIIPARGGSKGVKGKNLRVVGSVSLVGRAVRCALATEVIDHVFVSTDDEKILQEALRHGARVPFLRPAHLAEDNTSMAETLTHAIKSFETHIGTKVHTVVLLEPTIPFRTPEKVHEAVNLYKSGKYKSVISVCPLERKPENIFIKKGKTISKFIRKPKVEFNCRQDMINLCRLSSAVYVVGRNDFLESKKLILSPTGYIENTSIEAVNIDEELDLEFADFIAKKFGV